MAERNDTITMSTATSRTTTFTSADVHNEHQEACHLNVNITTPGTFSITPKLQGKDPVSGKYYDLIVGTAMTSTGMQTIKIGPGIAPAANAAAQDYLPPLWRAVVTANNANPAVYSVGANIMSA
jgi:hypothetical protein